MQNQFRPVGFNILPPVVKNIIIINGLLFFITLVLNDRFGISLTEKLALFYPESSYFRPYQLITHLFMHAGWTHLIFNMFSLWMFGSVLENYWGPKRFFIFYFTTGLGAAAIHIGFNAYEIMQIKEVINSYISQPSFQTFNSIQSIDSRLINNEQFGQFLKAWSQDQSNFNFIRYSIEIAEAILQGKMNQPTVGASGAVFGLLLGFGMLFPNTVLFLLFIPFPIKAKYFVLLYGAIELYLGVSNNPADNVAHFAHLGGMLFGFFLIKFWNKTNRNTFY
ncbi:MAG: rhomboid family intramembrane serine protease [Bacteroidia bacterium]|jgi:membrane associated rhomboid family serine protease|nr:rhomboid family intramembrane serine protease [Bacteroidia bacterium]